MRLQASDEDLPPTEVSRLLADYDVVLTHRDDRTPLRPDPRVVVRTLLREPIDVVVAADHPLAGHAAVHPAELADEDWISVRGGFPVDDVLLSIAAVTAVQPRITQRLNDFRVIESLVAAGCGVALMPRWAVTDPRLAVLPLADVRAGRVYELATRPHAERRPAVAAVLAAFTSAVAPLVDSQPEPPVVAQCCRGMSLGVDAVRAGVDRRHALVAVDARSTMWSSRPRCG